MFGKIVLILHHQVRLFLHLKSHGKMSPQNEDIFRNQTPQADVGNGSNQ